MNHLKSILSGWLRARSHRVIPPPLEPGLTEDSPRLLLFWPVDGSYRTVKQARFETAVLCLEISNIPNMVLCSLMENHFGEWTIDNMMWNLGYMGWWQWLNIRCWSRPSPLVPSMATIREVKKNLDYVKLLGSKHHSFQARMVNDWWLHRLGRDFEEFFHSQQMTSFTVHTGYDKNRRTPKKTWLSVFSH